MSAKANFKTAIKIRFVPRRVLYLQQLLGPDGYELRGDLCVAPCVITRLPDGVVLCSQALDAVPGGVHQLQCSNTSRAKPLVKSLACSLLLCHVHARQ